jgi:hypothetical protein
VKACITRRSTLAVLAGGISLIATARAQQGSGTTKGEPVLINNVRVFDGIEDQLTSANVLVADRKI